MIQVFLSFTSFIGLLYILFKLRNNYNGVEWLDQISNRLNYKPKDSITIVIPAFNEERNIRRCLYNILINVSILENWKIILIDDNSNDRTINIAKELRDEHNIDSNNFKIIQAGERPTDKHWVGKNWACSHALKYLTSEWVLFIDADIKLYKSCILDSIKVASYYNYDLLSIAPKLKCTCLTEWIVQPIMASLISLGFPIKEINRENSQMAFASGPFMLFKSNSYKSIGGHKSVSDKVVEDLALSEKIKEYGMKLGYIIGINSLEIRMYDDFQSLWEGWSKNWFIALDRDINKAILLSLFIFILYCYPWITICGIIINREITLLNCILLSLSFVSIFTQYLIRLFFYKKFKLPIKFWWLSFIGGFIISTLGIASAYKTISGINWTWKGRSLKKN